MKKSIIGQAALTWLVWILMLALIGAMGYGLYYQHMQPPKQPTTIAMDQPNMPANAIRVWANEAAVSAYSYDFLDYKKALESASSYFTPAGWKVFKDALDKSNTLGMVRTKRLVASAVATGAPVILNQGPEQGRYHWQVEIPLLVVYQSPNERINQRLLITMDIVRTTKFLGTRGVAITRFVAVTDQPANRKKPTAEPSQNPQSP